MALGATRRLSLLRRNRGFALLFWATAGSAVGTYFAALALSVDILDRTDSGRWLAALLIADFLPIVVIGVTLGPLVDRLSRRRLMIVSDLVRAGTFAALPFVDDPAAIVALAGVNGIATGFFRPAVWAGMPNLVSEDEREQATSLLTTVEHIAWTLGPILAGGLLAASGPEIAYWANAVTFVLSAMIVEPDPGQGASLGRPDHAGPLGRSPRRALGRLPLAPPRHGARRMDHGRSRDGIRQRRRGPVRQERDRRRQPRARLPRRVDRGRLDLRQLLRRVRARARSA